MTNKKVAIEQNLSTVKDYLSQEGYQCVNLDNQNQNDQGLEAIIISGADNNVMGVSNAASLAPVINAHGLTPEDISKRLKQLQQQ
ncbi:YkuS family protein [Tumebacillus permanentifrigoris]|uniref:Uncharacterized protein UPF0180 n=1 Tax=Tumebacillus permanentifrigoris TaxID=378543 RepID=A0A316DG13_9BACL|nr:YkuS family protein [Tumebacillus permanentifrigoris]PWK16596.1 uncharacterized protein UPF0180 [Tumebacillus permanentifrigoris]